MTLDLNNKTCLPTLKLLGDFWSLRIIDSLSNGEQRYCELQRIVGDVNPVTLTNRLKKLQEKGIISRNELSRAEVAYSLTLHGQKVLPVLEAINDFSTSAKRLSKKSK